MPNTGGIAGNQPDGSVAVTFLADHDKLIQREYGRILGRGPRAHKSVLMRHGEEARELQQQAYVDVVFKMLDYTNPYRGTKMTTPLTWMVKKSANRLKRRKLDGTAITEGIVADTRSEDAKSAEPECDSDRITVQSRKRGGVSTSPSDSTTGYIVHVSSFQGLVRRNTFRLLNQLNRTPLGDPADQEHVDALTYRGVLKRLSADLVILEPARKLFVGICDTDIILHVLVCATDQAEAAEQLSSHYGELLRLKEIPLIVARQKK